MSGKFISDAIQEKKSAPLISWTKRQAAEYTSQTRSRSSVDGFISALRRPQEISFGKLHVWKPFFYISLKIFILNIQEQHLLWGFTKSPSRCVNVKLTNEYKRYFNTEHLSNMHPNIMDMGRHTCMFKVTKDVRVHDLFQSASFRT